MNEALTALITPFLLMVMGALLLVGAVFIGRNIMANMRDGMSFRAALSNRVEELRLNKMLRHLGINRSEYLHTRSIVDIDQHIRNCNSCATKVECDAKLADPAKIDNYDFCPNHESLEASVQQQEGSANQKAAS